jgi:hypothetical protein
MPRSGSRAHPNAFELVSAQAALCAYELRIMHIMVKLSPLISLNK